MFGGIFDSIIILIPIAIIIGRFVVQARNKRKPPPPRPKPPPIPVHFMDDEDDKPVVRRAVKKERPSISMFEIHEPAQPVYKKPAEVTKKVLPLPVTQKQDDFFQKLNKLSPLKQAVIMAEVLGPPKALQ